MLGIILGNHENIAQIPFCPSCSVPRPRSWNFIFMQVVVGAHICPNMAFDITKYEGGHSLVMACQFPRNQCYHLCIYPKKDRTHIYYCFILLLLLLLLSCIIIFIIFTITFINITIIITTYYYHYYCCHC